METGMGDVIGAGRAQRIERRQIVLVGIVVDIELAHFGGRIDLELQPGAAEIAQRLHRRFRARGGDQIVFDRFEIGRDLAGALGWPASSGWSSADAAQRLASR